MTVVNVVSQELSRRVDKKFKVGAARFFKEEVRVMGVRSDQVKIVTKKLWPMVKNRSKREIFKYIEQLLASGYLEQAFVGLNWLWRLRRQFTIDDFRIFERWVKKYVSNWAVCDTFCTHSVGYLINQYPNLVPKVVAWTLVKNRWVKRAAAVTFIYPIKRRQYLKIIFKIADRLLLDKEDMVQKGYGWMLKVTGDSYRKEVFNYVMRHKLVMPRTALRYAIEKFPPSLKKQAMK